MKLRIMKKGGVGSYGYDGHISGIQPVPPSEFEKTIFDFIDLDLELDVMADIPKNKYRWDGKALAPLSAEHWNAGELTAEEKAIHEQTTIKTRMAKLAEMGEQFLASEKSVDPTIVKLISDLKIKLAEVKNLTAVAVEK